MLNYPEINPIAFHIGPLKVYWYGLMYGVAFLSAWGLGSYRARDPNRDWTVEDVSDLIFYGAVGVVLGGRLGYVLFYNFSYYAAHPVDILKVWDGGMSFHGGFIGVALMTWWFSKRLEKPVMEVWDFGVPLVPLGLLMGRLGNFINGELWGRVTSVPWAMVFPNAGPLPRHPSQLYEMFFEGFVLFIILWWYSAKPRATGSVTGLFLVAYGVFRFCLEFFRQPDPQLNFVAFGWMTQGQLLSIPMVFIGIYLLWQARRKTYATVS